MFSTNRRRYLAEIFMVALSFFLVMLSGIRLAGLKREALDRQTQTLAFSEAPAAPLPEESQNEESKQTETALPIKPLPLYVIRLVGNELRMIPGGQEEDYTVLSCSDPRTFREADRQRLIEGVEIYTYTQLTELLEDFSS